MRIIGLILFMLFTLSACQTFPSKSENGQILQFKEKTNMEAADMLFKALQEEGYPVKPSAPGQFILEYDNHAFIMEPKLIQGGLSRIVVSRLFEVKPEYRHSPELFVMIVALNRNLNFAKFSMLPENQAGQVQTSITFIHETLDTDEVRQFLKWMDNSLAQVKGMVPPEALHMLVEAPE